MIKDIPSRETKKFKKCIFFYQKIAIFVDIFAVKCKMFEIFCFPARNVLYTLEEVEIML